MGLFSRKKKELTQDDRNVLVVVLQYDKAKWNSLFPFPNFDIDPAIAKIENGQELDSKTIETCQNAIKRYVDDHKGNPMADIAKEIGKHL